MTYERRANPGSIEEESRLLTSAARRLADEALPIADGRRRAETQAGHLDPRLDYVVHLSSQLRAVSDDRLDAGPTAPSGRRVLERSIAFTGLQSPPLSALLAVIIPPQPLDAVARLLSTNRCHGLLPVSSHATPGAIEHVAGEADELQHYDVGAMEDSENASDAMQGRA